MKLPITTTPIQIRFSDLDILGHVSNSYYSQYFELGRIDLFAKVDRCPTVIANSTIDFIHEVVPDSEVLIESYCSRIGTKSMTVLQNLYANGKLCAKASNIVVGFNTTTRKSQALPEHWQTSNLSLLKKNLTDN